MALRNLRRTGSVIVLVKAAGLAVDFEDPYHFSRVFKQIHGVAPRDFKRGGALSTRRRE